MAYQERTFTLPDLDGLSKASIDAHLGLYAGYVKNCNQLEDTLGVLRADAEKNTHAIAELTRRLPFEWNGMRMHEYYFAQFEHQAAALDHDGALGLALAEQFESVETWEKQFRAVGAMRGPGWAVLYFDPNTKTFENIWVAEHHLGHLAGLPIILALDVWEHAFLLDYGTTARGKYIDACFKNYNWSVMEERFAAATHTHEA